MLLIKQSQIYILWGTHGNEVTVTRPLAHLVFSKFLEINPKGTFLVGPVSPWSCRNEYRFDRLMSDPNRMFDDKIPVNWEYLQLLKEWRSFKPKSLEQIQIFLLHIDQIGLNIGQLFTHCQINERDFFGYVNLIIQRKRLNFLTKIISQNIDKASPSHITLVDMHAGIGQDAETILYYEGSSKTNSRKFLIDALASNIYQHFNVPVRTLILETGVVNNRFGLINVLSEIAARTYGFDHSIPRISKIVNPEWMNKAKNHFKMSIFKNI